jgi:hypothetical protein
MSHIETEPIQENESFYFQRILQRYFDRYLQEAQGSASLRKFAEKIGVNAGNLLHVMKGRRGMHTASAVRIAENLGLSQFEKACFLRSIADFKGRNLNQKSSATKITVHVRLDQISQLKQLTAQFEADLLRLSQNCGEEPSITIELPSPTVQLSLHLDGETVS